jgi:hypothetical protein
MIRPKVSSTDLKIFALKIAHKILGRAVVQNSKKLWNQGLQRYLQILYFWFLDIFNFFSNAMSEKYC